MRYWNPVQMTGTTQGADDLVKAANGSGSCIAFAELLKKVWQISDIGAPMYRITPEAGSGGLMINSWDWKQADRGEPFPYMLAPGRSGPPDNQVATWGKLGGTTVPGKPLPGQGNPQPPATFREHWVLFLWGRVYDPSHGIGGVTMKEHKNIAFAGILDGTSERARKVDADNDPRTSPNPEIKYVLDTI